MRSRNEPVTMGSPRFTTIDTGAFRLTEAWFPPQSVLEPHTHDRHILAVMLDGSFRTRIGPRELDCSPTTTWTEPCEERHANFVGPTGARVLVTQPDPARDELLAPFGGVIGEVMCARDPMIALDARRLAVELTRPDSLTPLVADSLVVLVMARAARLLEDAGGASRPPAWLLRARDLVHDCYREPLSLHDIATEVGISQWHVAHEFRRHFLASIGEYARALRLNHALERLAQSDAQISEIALDAGYADQSHLTRACKAVTGLAPAAYRRHWRH